MLEQCAVGKDAAALAVELRRCEACTAGVTQACVHRDVAVPDGLRVGIAQYAQGAEDAWVRRSNKVGTMLYGSACLRERLIIAKVLTMRSRPLTARCSVCTGITSCWLAARAFTISTPSNGGLSMIA